MFDTIKKLFVDYEISCKLKELGFNEHCFAHYSKDVEYPDQLIIGFDSNKIENFNQYEYLTSCPLFSQVEDWIEQFDMYISRDFRNYILVYNSLKGLKFMSRFESDCILEAIEAIKNKILKQNES